MSELRNQLLKYSSLSTKEKRNISRELEDLLEDNFEEVKKLYIEFIELFESESRFESFKELFQEKFGNTDKLIEEHLLPKYISNFQSIFSKDTLSKEEEKICSNILNNLIKISPQVSYNIYDSFEKKINSYESLKSIITSNWQTLKKFKKNFQISSDFTLLETVNDIKIYQKLGNIQDSNDSIRGDIFSSDDERKSINLLVVGETGTGKSTLLNAMTNYLLGIKYDDPVRAKIIIENVQSISKSVTSTVTLYQIKSNPKIFPYPVRFIDTPGFGDTGGLKEDKNNANKLMKFIDSKCPELHGICFVMKASTTRLTSIQQYISQQILGIFGKDTANNFIGLLTYSDNKVPKALDAIKDGGLPIKNDLIFKFNNSAIYPDSKEDKSNENVTKFYFDMGYDSFEKFFDRMLKITPVSLKMTKEVIKFRKNLEVKLETLQKYIAINLTKLSAVKNNLRKINEYNSDLSANKDHTKTHFENYTEQIEVNPNCYNTFCKNCEIYCHPECYQNDNEKKGCSAMGSNGQCTVCPRKCPYWQHHNKRDYRIVTKTKQVTNKNETMERLFNEAKNDVNKMNNLVNSLIDEIKNTNKMLISQISDCKDCLNGLSRLALKKNTTDVYSYMDQMIELENDQKKPGYEKRIEQIKEIKMQYKIMVDMDRNEDIIQDKELEKLIQLNKEQQETTKRLIYN